MRALRKWVSISWRVVVVTAFAAVALLWVVKPVFEPIGLRRYDTTALIRRTFPIRLVQPQWIADQTNLYFEWSVSEARARFLLVVVCWVATCVTIVYVRVKGSASAQI
jgi:hypothetical protein